MMDFLICLRECSLVYFVICLETALPMLLADPPQNMIAQSQSGTGRKNNCKNYLYVRFKMKLN